MPFDAYYNIQIIAIDFLQHRIEIYISFIEIYVF